VEDEQRVGVTDDTEDVEAHQRSRDAFDEGEDKIDEGDSPDVEGHLKSKD